MLAGIANFTPTYLEVVFHIRRRPHLFTMKQYKATLYATREFDGAIVPLDTCLIKRRTYKNAEKIFFDERGWVRSPDMHIELDKFAREIETGVYDWDDEFPINTIQKD